MSSRRPMIALAIGSMKLSKYTRRFRFTAMSASPPKLPVWGHWPSISRMNEEPAPIRGLARNAANYGDRDFALYLRRSFAKSMGYSQAMLDRPVVGIVDTGSDYNNCHRTVPELIEAVKRGVLAAGGLPLAFPTVSLCEQGNRVNILRGDQACEKVVIPRGNLSPAAQGVLTGSLPEQVVSHVFKGGEISRGVIGPDAALVIAEDHIHDPVQAVLDGPVAAHDRPEEVRQHDQ